MTFTPLELAVLRSIRERHPADSKALEAQLATATVLNRQTTGVGFYTHLRVERITAAAIGGERLRSAPPTRIKGLEHEMGFVLWLVEGYADCLEGFPYGDESTEGIALETLTIRQ